MNKEKLKEQIKICEKHKSICLRRKRWSFHKSIRKSYKGLAEFWQLNIDDLERLL